MKTHCKRGHPRNYNKHGQCIDCASSRWSRMAPEEKSKKYAANKRNCISEAHVNKVPLSTIERMMVRNYYMDARHLTATTGVKYEVDHIIPTSKGGPHMPWNLQVLTATANQSKSDKI